MTIRINTISKDEYSTLYKDGVFLAPLIYLLSMERKYSHQNRRTKEQCKETPSWCLFFKDKHYNASRSFFHKTLSALTMKSKSIITQEFHSETGVISQSLVSYLRSIEDADSVLSFVFNFRAFASGQKKRMPRNISQDVESYNRLKSAVKTEYAQRLIGEYKAQSLSSNKKTQDFAILFRMPLYTLIETVFCADDDADVIKVIEEYRN